MLTLGFATFIAEKHGVNVAILLALFSYDPAYSYTLRKFISILPFFTETEIKKILNYAIKHNLIICSNSSNKFDKTKFYSIPLDKDIYHD